MTDSDAFYAWLLDKQGMGERSARDVRSRCLRVEKLLGISLDRGITKKLDQVAKQIAAALPEHITKDNKITPVISQLRRAVRLYAEFCGVARS